MFFEVKNFKLNFIHGKADVIAKCILPGIWMKAGLGENPDHFFTNMCKSMNKTLKCRTDYKEHELRTFVKKCMHLYSHRKIFSARQSSEMTAGAFLCLATHYCES